MALNDNMTMLTDFYELTMGNGYFEAGRKDEIAWFDMFFRHIPDRGGYAIMAGVEQIVDYMENLHFTDEDIEYLRSKHMFSEGFLDYLKNFKFECDVWAVPEGVPIFPQEPIVTVRGPVIQAQLLETMILLTINHESLIATKASRIVRAAQGRSVMEFGSRRAHGTAAAIMGARAAYIGGCAGTACTITDREFGIPALGTMAHSWVQLFPSEYEAFTAYAKMYPDNCILLIDTFDVLKSGLPNAIRVFKEQKPKGMGVRIDSGDIAYLTKRVRKELDAAGLQDCKITVSNSLDEYLIRDVIMEGAQIDSFGVGERMITAKSEPVFGGVYKLSAVEENGKIIPKIKISENVGKISNPAAKKLYRIYSKETGKAEADLIMLKDEPMPTEDGFTIFDPCVNWKKKTLSNYVAKDIRVQLFDHGKRVYDCPPIQDVQKFCKEQIDTLWEETLRFENPQRYFVDLSEGLYNTKQELIHKNREMKQEHK